MLLEKIKLEADEKILIQTRRHWFVLYYKLAGLVSAAVMPAIVMFVASAASEASGFNSVSLMTYSPQLVFLYCLWLFFLWIGIFNIWTNYYLDILTITDRRAILINQKGFFRRSVASFRLERLQDMNIEINGLLATLLDYGTLHAETAGHSDEEFRAIHLPKPRELKGIILEAADNRIPNQSDNSL